MFYLIKRGRLWSARIRLNGWSKWRTYSLGVSDKRVAGELAERLVQKLERQAAGMLPSDAVLNAAAKPVLDQLPAFLADVEARGGSRNTLRAYRQCIPFVLTSCGWAYYGDITAASFENWRSHARKRPQVPRVRVSGQVLNENRGKATNPPEAPNVPHNASPRGRYSAAGVSPRPLGHSEMCAPKYLNDLLGYVRSFLNWSVRRGFLDADPLRHVQPAKIRAGRGHRRALSHEELRLLFECAEIPRERRSTYMVAYYLGLRRNELRRLKRGDFDLDAARPVVRIPGIATKNAKPAVLDIPAALMPALRFLLPSEMAPFAYAFSPFGIPNMQTFRGDLTKAGICFKDFEGRRFDFHALRLTLCTHLRNAGVSKRRAMAIMRLSSERLLDHVYFDESQLSLAEELNKLPTFGVGGLSHGLSHGMDSGGLAAS